MRLSEGLVWSLLGELDHELLLEAMHFDHGSTEVLLGNTRSTIVTPDAWKDLLFMHSECVLSFDCLIAEPRADNFRKIFFCELPSPDQTL